MHATTLAQADQLPASVRDVRATTESVRSHLQRESRRRSRLERSAATCQRVTSGSEPEQGGAARLR